MWAVWLLAATVAAWIIYSTWIARRALSGNHITREEALEIFRINLEQGVSWDGTQSGGDPGEARQGTPRQEGLEQEKEEAKCQGR